MERNEERKSLRLKYKNKTAALQNLQNQKNTPSEPDSEKGKEVPDSYSTGKREVLPTTSASGNLQKMEYENLHNQQQVLHLKQDMDKQKQINQVQKDQITKLTNTIQEQTQEIAELKHYIQQKDNELTKLKETFATKSCTFDEFYQILHRQKENLSNETKMVKELEVFLSAEIDKNKKLEEELHFVIEHVNEEKEELKEQFHKFKNSANSFLDDCRKQKVTLLKLVEEHTQHTA